MANLFLLNPAPSVLTDSDRRISQKFGENVAVYTATAPYGHAGLDIAIVTGTGLRSAGSTDGTVTVSSTTGDDTGYGAWIEIRHEGTDDYPDGYLTLYGHMNYRAVQVGDKVKPGQYIGESGDTGFSSGPHLHLGLKVFPITSPVPGGWIDPLPFIRWDSDALDDILDSDDPSQQIPGALTYAERSKPLASQGIELSAWVIWRAEGASAPRAEEYISNDMRGYMSITRGRDMSAVEMGNPQMGTWSFTLDNQDGRYSRYNMASPLSPQSTDPTVEKVSHREVGVGRTAGISLWVDSEEVTLWRGIVTQLSPRITPERVKVVDVECRGPFWLYADTDTVFRETSVTSAGDLAYRIFNRTNLPFRQEVGRLLSSVKTRWTDSVDRWQAKGTAMSLWGRLETRVLGFVNERRDGMIEAWGQSRRRQSHSNAKAVFSDVDITDAHYRPSDVRMAYSEQLVYSVYRAQVGGESASQVHPPDVAAGGVRLRIWGDDRPRKRLAAGDVLEMRVKYLPPASGDYADRVDWTLDKTEVITKEYTVGLLGVSSYTSGTEVTHTPGSVTAPVSGMTAVVADDDPNTVVVTVTRSSTPATPLLAIRNVHLYGIRYATLDETANVEFVMDVEATENLYGRREFPIVPIFTTFEAARDWIEQAASQYGEERPRLEMTFAPKTGKECIELCKLDLDDLIDVRLTARTGFYVNRHMYIQRIIYEVDHQHVFKVTFQMVDEAVYASGFNWEAEGRFYT